MNIRALLPLAAVLVLTGCGGVPASVAESGGTPSAPASPTVAALSCRQQYETWKQSAAPEARKLEAALKRVQTAGGAEDLPATASALHKAGRAAARLSASFPMPKCADPKGYYTEFLARITAAGDNATDGSGLGALILAEAPLQTVQKIEKKLAAELGKTVGKNH